MSFRVVPISASLVSEARSTMLSPQYKGLPAFSSIATGYGPCRSCLETFKEGAEYRTSFTYDPNEGFSDLPQPGPVFVHTHECEEFSGPGFPAAIRHLPMFFEAFDKECEMVTRRKVEQDILESQIESLLGTPQVEFVKVRNAEAGCFIARIDKV